MDPTIMPEPGDPGLDSIITTPEKPYRVQARVAWILMAVVAVISLIPVLGFASWFVAGPMLLVAFIMTIIVFSKGGVGHGLALLGCQLIVMPVIVLLGPILSSALGFVGTAAGVGAAIEESSRPHETESTYNPVSVPAPSVPDDPVPPESHRLPVELDALKTKMLGQQSQVASWLGTGGAAETPSGFLKPGDSLDMESRRLLQQQNLWREQAFARIAEMTGTSPEEVARSYARLATRK